MTLTGCIVHGFGVFLYLIDEGMGTGANWTIEVVSLQQLPPTRHNHNHILCLRIHDASKAMRSIDRAYAIAQGKNRPFPSECLVTKSLGY